MAAGNSGLLTGRIGNPSLSRLESGFPAVTEPPLEHDYYLMATYWEEPQPNWRVDDSAVHVSISGPSLLDHGHICVSLHRAVKRRTVQIGSVSEKE